MPPYPQVAILYVSLRLAATLDEISAVILPKPEPAVGASEISRRGVGLIIVDLY